MCVDVVRSAERKQVVLTPADFFSHAVAEDKPQELFARLLIYADRQIEYAVRALCGSRGFNYQIYKHLGQALDFAATQPDFEILTEFSFVWQDEKHGEDWYRIHDLLRRLYRENPQETTQRAHRVLEAYWREQGNISEAIYHANCLDWEKGLTEWVEVFEKALRLSRYDLCRALLEVRSELDIGSYEWLGYISASEGDYFAQLARHAEAEAELTEAIAAYDQALTRAPDYINALNNKGLALQSLGKLQAGLAQHTEALESYGSAIAAYDRALTRAPDDIYALNNKGNALASLGELQARLAQHPEAVESYGNAIAAYEQALTRAPDDISALNNKGLALISLGNLYSELSMNEEAIKSWQTARSTLSQSLKIAPNNTYIQNLYDELVAFI